MAASTCARWIWRLRNPDASGRCRLKREIQSRRAMCLPSLTTSVTPLRLKTPAPRCRCVRKNSICCLRDPALKKSMRLGRLTRPMPLRPIWRNASASANKSLARRRPNRWSIRPARRRACLGPRRWPPKRISIYCLRARVLNRLMWREPMWRWLGPDLTMPPARCATVNLRLLPTASCVVV